MIEAPKIGKNLIEILTDGMYKNPLFMYREYVQNASDAIDDAVKKNYLNSAREGVIKIKIGLLMMLCLGAPQGDVAVAHSRLSLGSQEEPRPHLDPRAGGDRAVSLETLCPT